METPGLPEHLQVDLADPQAIFGRLLAIERMLAICAASSGDKHIGHAIAEVGGILPPLPADVPQSAPLGFINAVLRVRWALVNIHGMDLPEFDLWHG